MRELPFEELYSNGCSLTVHGNEYHGAETVSISTGVNSLRCPARQDVEARQPTRAGARELLAQEITTLRKGFSAQMGPFQESPLPGATFPGSKPRATSTCSANQCLIGCGLFGISFDYKQISRGLDSCLNNAVCAYSTPWSTPPFRYNDSLRLKIYFVRNIHSSRLRHPHPFVDEPSLRAALHGKAHLASISQHPQYLNRGRLDCTLE